MLVVVALQAGERDRVIRKRGGGQGGGLAQSKPSAHDGVDRCRIHGQKTLARSVCYLARQAKIARAIAGRYQRAGAILVTHQLCLLSGWVAYYDRAWTASWA